MKRVSYEFFEFVQITTFFKIYLNKKYYHINKVKTKKFVENSYH